jgi:histidyl-tRNA synthetase
VDVELCIVRGLAYYSGIVFELFDAQRDLRAICGGGRYDGLLAALGGADLPAVGFGMGDVVLGELLKERGLAPAAPAAVDVFVAAATMEDRIPVLGISHGLRDAGLRVEYALAHQNLRKQLELANARRARLAVVVGPEERARGMAIVRELASGDQREVALADLASELRSARPVTSHVSPLTSSRG